MKIKINTELSGGESPKNEFNSILRLAIPNKSLSSLKEAIEKRRFYHFSFGFGGSHCWVKQKDINGNEYPQNILIITEN